MFFISKYFYDSKHIRLVTTIDIESEKVAQMMMMIMRQKEIDGQTTV